MPAFLTTRQVAEILGVDINKVCDWLASGDLIGVNIARNAGGIRPRWRISEAALAQFIEGRQTQPPAPRAERRKQAEGVTSYY